MTTTPSNWEREYERQFGKDQDGPVIFSGDYQQLQQSGFFRHPDYEKIKAFISTTREEAKREERERIERKINWAIGIKLEKTAITPDDPSKEYLSKAHILALTSTGDQRSDS